MADSPGEAPPPDAEGLDRPSENEDELDDLHDEFDDPQTAAAADPADADSDDESLLSEVDEAQFADFDPTAVQVAPDFDTLNKAIKVTKRKRADGEEEAPKKKKERTREKVRRNQRKQDSDDGFSGGEEVDGKRSRKSKGDGERKPKAPRPEINEEDLTPEERRRRALDRAMDAAVKKSAGKRLRKGDIDLEQMADAEIEEMRNKMIAAAEADGELVRQGLPASEKLKMLPNVVSLLNRNNIVQSILDPETNLLEAVRFFLEPLSDGSLPAYNIQRELFAALGKLPMNKETLISSGIGKVMLFYRKSKRAEPAIKRQATKLMEEWSRPILQRSDDYTKKTWARATYDPTRRRDDGQSAVVPKAKVNVAPGQKQSNRARLLPGATSYTIVPEVSTIVRR
ncbi:Transcription factor iws1 [Elasticomyces elasticus]|uniref:Transcription factor iws1 n=1 Tax=Exophiala sideris TaxID=1016849 RepID=A0ABR0JGL3_9EURO|nr:Transcription factor iws1 [Elasticomyces elasticus]KAK5033190.1 Transcription factor iws1 [Exophiala sideris]KAK5042310.1 Transcription factor iws1 [Exophiala sideris]KAK5063734.1 Transcription factor iws1 [Exophiala sideris]KAK5185577.1 Transcription factor iws1 [Eurotiomycetes sp. CCFEE 6388]